jgi:hypothetical protein
VWAQRETMQPTGYKNASGLSFSSTAGIRPDAAPLPFSAQSSAPIFEKPGPKITHYPEELHALMDQAALVRRRILANRSLGYWFVSLNWILGALILAAAFSRHLRAAGILAVIFVLVAAVGSFLLAKRKGPSVYGAACQLDAMAGLQDRLSTTVYFGAAEDPGWMILHQRRDALAQLKNLNASALFPLQMPATIRRTLAMALVAAGFVVYRIEYGPPALTLIHKAAQTHVAEALISPLVRAVESTPLNVFSQRTPDVLDEEAATAGMPNHDEKTPPVFPFGEPNTNNSDGPGQENSPGLFPTDSKGSQRTNQSQNQMQSQGDASQSSDQSHEQNGANPNSQKGASNGKTPAANQGQSNGAPSKGGQQSLGQKLVDALKQMMGSMSGQDANQSPSQPPPDTQGPSAQGQGGQSSGTQGKGGQQASLNDDKAKNTPANSGAHSGAGNGTQQPSAQKQPTLDAAQQNSANLVPERVTLDASDFRVQTHPRAMPGPGTAEVPLTNATATGAATTNGAEQEDIPLRYRQYVQRYFAQGQK